MVINGSMRNKNSDAYILAKAFFLKGEGFNPKAIRLANKKRIQKEIKEGLMPMCADIDREITKKIIETSKK